MSRANFTHAPAVVIARADLYPGALVRRRKRLGATTAYVIGDTTALAAKVDADVVSAGVTTIVRLGGTTRYDTAALIAERVGGTSVYSVRGDDWADAAAVLALAAFQHRPVLLTPATTLAPAASGASTVLHSTSATIVGGPSAVSTTAEQALNAAGVTTTSLSGPDRWATSAAVASSAVAAGMTGPPWLASGANQTWLTAHPSNVIVTLGGPDVVSAQDVATARI